LVLLIKALLLPSTVKMQSKPEALTWMREASGCRQGIAEHCAFGVALVLGGKPRGKNRRIFLSRVLS
jgi:hypothetical protein